MQKISEVSTDNKASKIQSVHYLTVCNSILCLVLTCQHYLSGLCLIQPKDLNVHRALVYTVVN